MLKSTAAVTDPSGARRVSIRCLTSGREGPPKHSICLLGWLQSDQLSAQMGRGFRGAVVSGFVSTHALACCLSQAVEITGQFYPPAGFNRAIVLPGIA